MAMIPIRQNVPLSVEETAKLPKSIIIFSDGTGNSSAKLFKTNVWRMYEAVDLGLPDDGDRDRVQVAYYDNGVGTSNFRPLALLSGIFGIGLKRNVLAIYRFVCRNFGPEDRIYAFGFSRGAFTIRLVASLIAAKGIVRYETERELNARSADLFREFHAANNPNFLPIVGTIGRTIRDLFVALKRFLIGPRLRGRSSIYPSDIEFLGVWDTVAAYGGPSAEITRAIDNFIWPLTMTDQTLSDGVKVARHALALDDERDSFHPVLWDELDWAIKRDPEVAPEDHAARLQQVWFAGMHSDVGGGYPDESLSYVSLLWMMEEAQAAGLRLLPEHVRRVHSMSNSLGPVHNSRSGLASYYRYQPRRIDAFLHPNSGMDTVTKTLIMRDPVLGEKQVPPQGYLLDCKVHESVFARIAFGTDDYAPIGLPAVSKVVSYSTNFVRSGGHPHVSLALRNSIEGGDPNWTRRHEQIYGLVWLRRVLYFFTAGVSILLVSMPLYAHWFAPEIEGRFVYARLTGWTHYFPNLAQPWVKAFEQAPGFFWLTLIAIAIGASAGRAIEWMIRSRMRSLWSLRAAADEVPAPGTKRPPFRDTELYQRGLQIFKWYLLPIYVGLALVFLAGYFPLVVATQIRLSFDERTYCRWGAKPMGGRVDGSVAFDTRSMCNPTGWTLQQGHRYALLIAIPHNQKWSDGEDAAHRQPTTPAGLPASAFGLNGYLGVPMRRLVDARYLQLILQLRPRVGSPPYENVLVSKLATSQMSATKGCTIYRADFVASNNGKMFLYVNDAVGLIATHRFYDNNEGQARLYLYDLSALPGSPAGSSRGQTPTC